MILKDSEQEKLDSWAAQVVEPAIEPELPILDAHHHLWNKRDDQYRIEDFAAEIARSGHNVRASVFVETDTNYRKDGPPEMRPVGETEYIAGVAAESASQLCAGIVVFADLRLGDAVRPVLEAHLEAGGGRVRGLRQTAQWDPVIGADRPPQRRGQPGLLMDPEFRAGFALLGPLGLVFDAGIYHPQLPEATDLARAFPDTVVMVSHCGRPLRSGLYAERPEAAVAQWRRDIEAAAACPNTVLKLGGLGNPVSGFDWQYRAVPPGSDEIAAGYRPFVEIAVDAFSPDRCMFESNFPVEKRYCGYGALWNGFKKAAAGYSADERAALFGGTAARVFRLTGF